MSGRNDRVIFNRSTFLFIRIREEKTAHACNEMRAHAWRIRPYFHASFPLEISVVHARVRTMHRPRTWQMFHFMYTHACVFYLVSPPFANSTSILARSTDRTFPSPRFFPYDLQLYRESQFHDIYVRYTPLLFDKIFYLVYRSK